MKLFSFLRGNAASVPAVEVEAPAVEMPAKGKGKVTLTVATKLDAATYAALFNAGKASAELSARMSGLLKEGMDQKECRKAFKCGYLVGYMRKAGHASYSAEDALRDMAKPSEKAKAGLTSERKAWQRLLDANGIATNEKRGGARDRKDGEKVNDGKDGVTGNVEPKDVTPDAPDAESVPDAPKAIDDAVVVTVWPSNAACVKDLSARLAIILADIEANKAVAPSGVEDAFKECAVKVQAVAASIAKRSGRKAKA